MIAPTEACHNLQRLTAEGQQGPYGMYEAIDYHFLDCRQEQSV